MKTSSYSKTMERPPNGGLIGTKLAIPPLKAKMVARTHLLNRLSSAKECKLIVVSGVPGSGKTSLACQWIAEDHLPVAWYSLDKTDNDADLFFRYLLIALTGFDDRLSRAIEPFLQGRKRISGPEIIPLIIRLFVDLPRDIYLVLDDYHLIHTKEIHDALSYFLEYMPPRMHMVILSRHAIPLSLSRFRVRSQLTEIVASDLKFTEEETERFFTDIMPVTLTTDEVHELARYTEGWVGGLQLFGLSLKGKGLNDLGDILSRACQETTDYLIDEVIKVQPRKVKTFIQTTALLDRFNVDLCREVTGFTDTPDILEHLYRNNLFLIPLNTENTWHRYHHLLSEAVRKGVKNINPALYRDIQRKAALWFARHGYLEDALRHAFASEDYEFAADIMEDYKLFLFEERYEIALCQRWLAKLPSDVYMQRPLLRFYDCGLRMSSLKLDEIEAILNDIENHKDPLFDQYRGSKRRLCEDMLIHHKALLVYFRDADKADLAELDKAARAISPDNFVLSGLIRVLIGLIHYSRGEAILAGRVFKEASHTIGASESVRGKVIWARHASMVERMQGHLHRALPVLKDAFSLLERKGLSEAQLRSLLCLPMGWIAYYRNNIEEAFEYAQMAAAHAENSQYVYDMLDTNTLLAYVYQAQGATEKVDYHIEHIRKVAKECPDPNVMSFVDSTTARIFMARGNLGWAEAWARQRTPSADETFSLLVLLETLTYGEFLYRSGLFEDAVRLFEGLREKCIDRCILEHMLDIDIFLCASLHALKLYDRADAILESALKFSEAEEYMRPFVNYSSIIAPLMLKLARDGRKAQESPYFAALLKACGIILEDINLAGEKEYGGLTAREIEILEYIAMGYQNKEIASSFFVSLHTIKTHIKHIFAKLNATTRTEAVRRFQELKSPGRNSF